MMYEEAEVIINQSFFKFDCSIIFDNDITAAIPRKGNKYLALAKYPPPDRCNAYNISNRKRC